MMRNRLTLTYARGDAAAAAAACCSSASAATWTPASGIIATSLLMALMFPVYYNLLSMFVTRRDELVLKRLRTGEVRDARAGAVDGASRRRDHARGRRVLTVAVAMATGLPFPLNPLLLLVVVLMAVRRRSPPSHCGPRPGPGRRRRRR